MIYLSRKFMQTALTFLCLLIIISCKSPTESNNNDYKVEIINHYIGSSETFVIYTIENTGSKPINGWKIYFDVSFNYGSDYVVPHQTSLTIHPGEKTPNISARKLVAIFRRDVKTKSAKLKRLVTY